MLNYSFVLIMPVVLFYTNLQGNTIDLRDQKQLFELAEITKPNQNTEFSARLSPSGRYLIYPRQVGKNASNETYFKLIALNLETDKEHILPVDLPEGYQTVFTRFNFFDSSGEKLSLLQFREYPEEGYVVLYDLKNMKEISMDSRVMAEFAMFDYTGQRLIAKTRGPLTLVNLSGVVLFKIPSGGWIHSTSPFSKYATVFVPPMRGIRQVSRFELWDMDEKMILVELPMHQQNRSLDDVTAQWTLNGQYVYYIDLVERPGENGRRNMRNVTRIWDTKTNKEKTCLDDVAPIGPGPVVDSMFMTQVRGRNISEMPGLLLHRVGNDELLQFGPTNARFVHGWGMKVVYVVPKDGKNVVFIANVSMNEQAINRTSDN